MYKRQKQLSARRKTRRSVDQEKNHDKQRRSNTENFTAVMEAVFKKFRQSERIAGADGITAQARADKNPVEDGTDSEADGNPDLAGTKSVSYTHL